MCVVIAAWFVLPANMWRRLAYGSVLGIVSVYCLLLALLYVRLGRLVSSNYQESSESNGIMDPWTPYVIPVGALVGASVAIAFSQFKRTGVNTDAPSEDRCASSNLPQEEQDK